MPPPPATEAPLASPATRFDLAEDAAYVIRTGFQGRVALGFLAGVFLALGAAVPLLVRTDWPALFPFWLFGGLFAYFAASARTDPPFDRLEIDEVGLRFHFVDGAELFLPWSDPGFDLVVTDRSTDPTASSDEQSHLRVRLPDARAGTISKRLLVTLEDTALAHGVSVHTAEERHKEGPATWRAP